MVFLRFAVVETDFTFRKQARRRCKTFQFKSIALFSLRYHTRAKTETLLDIRESKYLSDEVTVEGDHSQ
jgi:hypothetical protein